MPNACFLVLCAVAGSAWALPQQSFPAFAATLAALGAGYLAIGLAAWGLGERADRAGSFRFRQAWAAIGATGVPAILTVVAARHLAGSMVLATWAALPLLLELSKGMGQSSSGLDMGALLLACLGWGGLLLLLPVHLPGSVTGCVSLGELAGAVVCAGFLARRAHAWVCGGSGTKSLLPVAFANALLCAGTGFLASRDDLREGFSRDPGFLLSFGLTAFEGALILLLLRWLPPRRWGTRVLFPPVLAIGEAAVLLRTGVGVRMLAGIGVTSGAALLLWFWKDEPPPMSLR